MSSRVAMTALLTRSRPHAGIFDGDGCGRLHSWLEACCSMTMHRGGGWCLHHSALCGRTPRLIANERRIISKI